MSVIPLTFVSVSEWYENVAICLPLCSEVARFETDHSSGRISTTTESKTRIMHMLVRLCHPSL